MRNGEDLGMFYFKDLKKNEQKSEKVEEEMGTIERQIVENAYYCHRWERGVQGRCGLTPQIIGLDKQFFSPQGGGGGSPYLCPSTHPYHSNYGIF